MTTITSTSDAFNDYGQRPPRLESPRWMSRSGVDLPRELLQRVEALRRAGKPERAADAIFEHFDRVFGEGTP